MTNLWLPYVLTGLLAACSAALVALNLPAFRRSRVGRARLAVGLVASLGATGAHAHFLFVVPDANGTTARVILSEDLQPDADVEKRGVAAAKLSLRDAAGHDAALTLAEGEGAMTVATPGTGNRVVYGSEDLGVKQRGDSPAYRLVYHPKTILGDAFDAKATLGDALTPVEIVPRSGGAGELAFEVQVHGKPRVAAEVNVILPGGARDKAVTDSTGRTPAFHGRGAFGAWERYFEPTTGEAGGKAYAEVRHYATLVVTVDAGSAPATRPAVAGAYPPMPQAASSFGAVASDGWLYVYGGHISPTHSYSTAAVSGEFHRLNLTDGKGWEALPGGTKLQGMNLAASGGKVYRVGGMEPRNAPGEPADNYSVSDVARFDPAVGNWEPLPALPEGRSSHDVVVIDGKLFVVGGWSMSGAKGGNHWLDTMLVMDLSKRDAQWEKVKQPFQRRALIATGCDGKLYVFGGFDEASEASQEVNVYDVRGGTWSTGPHLPGKEKNGFAPAACVANGRVYVSVGDGTMYRLTASADAWEPVAKTTPRIVHRLAPWGSQILVLGGAGEGTNFDLIEGVDVTRFPEEVGSVKSD